MKHSYLFISTLLLLIGTAAWTQDSPLYEKDYVHYIQSLIGGETEVAVDGGRIDLLTDEYAFEIEWASNWKEAIGQSLWYGLNTNRKPAIILILKDDSQYKYLIQLNTALAYANLADTVRVLAFPHDFQEAIGP